MAAICKTGRNEIKKIKFKLLPATQADLTALELNLRVSDQIELAYLEKATRSAIFPQIKKRCETDSYYTFFADNDVVCVGGISPHKHIERVGVIWLLGTVYADVYWRQMTRMCRNFIDAHSLLWNGLVNVIPPDQEKRIKWLKHLGFDIEKEKANISGYEFVQFSMDTRFTAPKTVSGS